MSFQSLYATPMRSFCSTIVIISLCVGAAFASARPWETFSSGQRSLAVQWHASQIIHELPKSLDSLPTAPPTPVPSSTAPPLALQVLLVIVVFKLFFSRKN